MLSKTKTLVRVHFVTANYVVIQGDQEGLNFIHLSQVTGTPKVGDWVEAEGQGNDMKLKPQVPIAVMG